MDKVVALCKKTDSISNYQATRLVFPSCVPPWDSDGKLFGLFVICFNFFSFGDLSSGCWIRAATEEVIACMEFSLLLQANVACHQFPTLHYCLSGLLSQIIRSSYHDRIKWTKYVKEPQC
ncbi:hypothetical protein NE237_016131 [Protea cynaroides]|uniref:Uncharacterized protein n=1 Tax=Protea cynaroides TaxID=273540 RepID=A0A9Q0QRK9_9MAGN|nr:hypothetical protein NE237_016131 [Protea cynaroides]